MEEMSFIKILNLQVNPNFHNKHWCSVFVQTRKFKRCSVSQVKNFTSDKFIYLQVFSNKKNRASNRCVNKTSKFFFKTLWTKIILQV